MTSISSDNDTVTIKRVKDNSQYDPSLKVIWENIDSSNKFSFDLINPDYISQVTNTLNTSKAAQPGDIPTNVIKDNRKTFFRVSFCKLW